MHEGTNKRRHSRATGSGCAIVSNSTGHYLNCTGRFDALPSIPGTTFTSGVPFTAAIRSTAVSSPARGSEEKEQWGPSENIRGGGTDIRRLKRYSTAEGKLATTFRNCNTEVSPQELQIRALEKATSILNSYAHDARDRAQQLQVILADHEMDPAVFETLKRERWMEEKRQLAVEQERKAVLQHLETLTKPSYNDGSHTQAQAPTAQVRQHTNLIRFLRTSQTHKPVHPHITTSGYVGRSQRRRTMDKVSPMRLRTNPAISNHPEPAKRHFRSISLDGRKSGGLPSHLILYSRVDVTSEPNQPAPHIPLGLVTEHEVSSSPSSYTTTALSDHSTISDVLPSTPLTISISALPAVVVPLSLSREGGIDPNDQGGTATIYRPTPHIPSDNLIDHIHVSLPDYAVDLFADFEADITPLLPISYPSEPQRIIRTPNISSSQQIFSPIPTSSSLQIPPSTNKRSSHLGRSNSYRSLGSLFSVPEALSSRLGVEKSSLNPPNGVFFTRHGHEATPNSSVVSPTEPRDLPADVTPKVKKRFSLLRRQ